jgi:PKD repeat protein
VSFSASTAPGLYCGSDSPSYDWDFGDGTAHGNGPGPSHTYAVAGNYDWSVTASTAGANCTRAGSITIAPCPIVCSATVPATGTATQPVVFAASVTESCGGGVTYDWDFGDGSAHSSAESPSHTYASGGSYTWSLTVSGSGVSCTHGGSIAVSAPTPPPSVSSMFKQGSPFRINVNGINLQSGIRVFINGSEWTNIQYKNVTLIKLKGGGSLKALVPKNTPTTFRFDNPDGGSQTLVWQWP